MFAGLILILVSLSIPRLIMAADFGSQNVGILCNPTPDQVTPFEWWLWQGGPKTCVNQDAVTWSIGDFTGFYPTGDLSTSQRGVDSATYGSQAVQFQGGTFGILLDSDSVLDSYSTLDAFLIDYEYETNLGNDGQSTHIFPFTNGLNQMVYSLQLQIPSASVTGPSAAYAVGYLRFKDTLSGLDLFFGASIFDTRGTSVAKETILLDACNFCTGNPIVIGVSGQNGNFTSNAAASAPFQSKPWLGFKLFSFSISRAQFVAALQAIKSRYPQLAGMSSDPASYALLEYSLNPELAPLSATPFGPGVSAQMGLAAKQLSATIMPNPDCNAQVAATFNETEYLAQYPDVAAAVAARQFASGWQHYVLYGKKEGRNPNLCFNEALYLTYNLDVAAAVSANQFVCGWDHYVQFGESEGRRF